MPVGGASPDANSEQRFAQGAQQGTLHFHGRAGLPLRYAFQSFGAVERYAWQRLRYRSDKSERWKLFTQARRWYLSAVSMPMQMNGCCNRSHYHIDYGTVREGFC